LVTHSQFKLKEESNNESKRYYEKQIKGAHCFRIFGGDQARNEARDQVVTKTLSSLMWQVMRDVDFYAVEEP
jgi:hypothetical protein